ncbi:hypothetical protein TcasGA2_TC009048 [Tribolium castaneum]|uniref:Phorbol-ester/DAG-type domain-containing protein n=1 Tax=Tribolium castaneum TaxID=7070 RepID=D6WPM9_TRICA|nr:PREDICTED: uncharacterized protein LOC656448 [Tribolium castaneum]EFA06199.1 hypothetical protein TcasGA2_TC009048 [Tribolium castaneum]|eukprot:XP_976191.3 PREDICTED: uncharacterized protein LOC656448 [Tribolium castaneum]
MPGISEMAAPDPTIPPCYVLVRKLTMEEITRMTLSPLFISRKCKFCRKFAYNGLECPKCSVHYHYECALMRRECCGVRLQTETSEQLCSKCKVCVYLGPQCSFCHRKYHSSCITPYEQCCGFNLSERPAQKPCGKCKQGVSFGPRCPLCARVYHSECVENEKLVCCNVKVLKDENVNSRCYKCQKRVMLSTPMCQFCGNFSHKKCLKFKGCCGDRRPSLELFFVPSFKFMLSYFNQFDKKKALLTNAEVRVRNRTRSLRSTSQDSERGRTRSMACQTPHPLDNIVITSIKTADDDSDSPPVLERENYTPPTVSSSSSRLENDDTLKDFFDFLCKTIKKFPPQLQTQVKVDLFKIVSEAELRLQRM